MPRTFSKKYMIFFFLGVLLLPMAKTLLPIVLPFLLGSLLALAAEPAVAWLHGKLHLGRGVAAGIGVTSVFLLSASVLTILMSLLFRQLGQLSEFLPAVSEAIQQGTSLLKSRLLSLAGKLPDTLQSVISGIVESLFSDSTGVLRETAKKLPQLAGNVLGRLSSGFIGIFTAVLSAFMISSRLPQLQQQLKRKIPDGFLTAAKGFRRTLLRWILAQGKLAAVAFGLLWTGFLILKIQHPLLWAALVTMVDILPILGVGTVLLPWSIVSYLQADTPRALGLLCIFLLIWMIRSVLEPKLVGKELGLDPLATLLCIYAGFRLWGLAGILLAPIAAVGIVQLRRKPWSESGSEAA